MRGAWWVLRANRAWAPYPQNDPDRARELMRRSYALVAGAHDLPIDPRRAAALEVDWCREHRILQREPDGQVSRIDDAGLVAALTALYAYDPDVSAETVRPAAQWRWRARHLSDDWVGRGRDPDDPWLRGQQRTSVTSYASLRQAVERQQV